MPTRFRRPWAWCLLILVAGFSCGCTQDGHISILGYTTEPNYDSCIHTVYVPIFQNVTFRREVEFDMTRAVIREIEATTPFKVVSCRDRADTELLGKIVSVRKNLINQNQLGEVREAETGLGVEVVWRDLRPGHVGECLSAPKKKESELPPPGARPKEPPPAIITPQGFFIPEVGGSFTSAERQMVDRVARQVTYLMERPW
jgi:hypothetical protein